MVSTILSPKASEIMLQPTLTTAISAAANSPARLHIGTVSETSPSSSQPIT